MIMLEFMKWLVDSLSEHMIHAPLQPPDEKWWDAGECPRDLA
jgi:hypothetical protein